MIVSKVRVDDWKKTYSVQFGDPREPNVMTVSFSVTCSDLDQVERMHEKIEKWCNEQRGLSE